MSDETPLSRILGESPAQAYADSFVGNHLVAYEIGSMPCYLAPQAGSFTTHDCNRLRRLISSVALAHRASLASLLYFDTLELRSLWLASRRLTTIAFFHFVFTFFLKVLLVSLRYSVLVPGLALSFTPFAIGQQSQNFLPG